MGAKAPGSVGALDLVDYPALFEKGQITIKGNPIPFVAEKLHELSVAQRLVRAVENTEKLQPQRCKTYVVGCENMGILVHYRIPKGHRG